MHDAGLQPKTLLRAAPFLAQERFDQPGTVIAGDIRLHVDLRLGAQVPGQGRAQLDGQL